MFRCPRWVFLVPDQLFPTARTPAGPPIRNLGTRFVPWNVGSLRDTVVAAKNRFNAARQGATICGLSPLSAKDSKAAMLLLLSGCVGNQAVNCSGMDDTDH